MNEELDYCAVLEAVPAAFVVVHPDAPRFTIAAVSDAYLRVTMTVRDRILGEGLFDILPGDPATTCKRDLLASLVRVLESKSADTMAIRRYDVRRPHACDGFEERYWSSVNAPAVDGKGAIRYIVHRIEDVTELVRSHPQGAAGDAQVERQLAEARTSHPQQLRDRLISMLEATPDFVGFCSARTGQVLYINMAGRRMCGVSPDEDVTKLHVSHFHPAWAYKWLAEEIFPAAAHVGFWSGEIPFRHRAGREIPALMILMSHRGADGEVEIFSTISRDISDRKQAEEVERQLLREQSARAAAEEAVHVRDDFVAIAGHELKTPLAALLMQVESMRRNLRTGQTANHVERLDRIAKSGRRLEKLIDELLDVSRITTGRLRLEPEIFDLTAMVGEVVDRFREAGTHPASSTISVRVSERVTGYWDRQRIDQVVTNLLSNALKYGQSRPIEIEMGKDGDSAVVRVIDHGIGIDRAHQERIFQRFERAVAAREYGGFGLGLWIASQIIEASGGTLAVESELHRGSTFTFRLPLRPVRQQAAQ
jgi:PAS domain S-box-containing protein